MKFKDKPLIASTTLFRAAMVSTTRGNRILQLLEDNGEISPSITPTRRKTLSPSDGEILFHKLVTRG